MKNAIYILFFILLSCTTQFEYQNTSLLDKKYEKVSLIDIINKPLDYNEKYIEVEGFYYTSIEQSVITSSEELKEGIWIDLNSNLINKKGEKLLNNDRIFNYSKKHLRIKGKFIEQMKGHLGLYKGTIVDIVYFGNVTKS